MGGKRVGTKLVSPAKNGGHPTAITDYFFAQSTL
jgi:hypothetical protein